jgi:hypothetical protein
MIRYLTPIHDSARWDGFVFRPGDIVISTPPKCGTTWTQMICALLIFQTPDLPDSLDRLSPWLDMLTRSREDVFADLDAQTHRRFIKTHTARDGLPWDECATYIFVGRDPRDVFLSWDNHMQNMDLVAVFQARAEAVGNDDLADVPIPEFLPTERERFWKWVDDDRDATEFMCLRQMMHHTNTFWDVRDAPNVVLVHYDDLRADLEGEMRRIAARVGITVPEARWPALVRAASFEEMKANADRVAPDTTHRIWQDNQRFFNRGTSGQWGELLGDEDLTRYFARVDSLAPPDVVAWLHRG